ncbi:hypothetical protein GH714_019118 [Hevea brasiliensis]|uniref:aspartate--tRNA ligase n=1 Tax=Hevea brasiliensis TaxID=3981 RepID=A0A6A6LC45_HEVBR|nr:hypothetical protein GH714_019118 [Hevea brasiliensis]
MFPQIMESSEVLPSSNNGTVELDLRGCKMLNSLPNSICELKCLETLYLSGCSNIEKLSPLYGLCSLRKLFLDGTALVEIPPDIVSLSSLALLYLNDTPMEELPSSIGCLSSLVILNLGRCKKLKSLPNSICELKCLKTLRLSGCSNLEKLPPLYGLCSLRELFLDGTALVEIPPDIVSLSSLALLYLNDTPMEELPSSIGCLSSLVSLNLQRCKKLKSLPNSICELECLETLHLSGCSNLEKLPPLYGLCSLRDLYLDGTALVKIPLDIFSLSSLGVLFLNDTPIEESPSSIGCELNFYWLKQNCDMENKATFHLYPENMWPDDERKLEVKRFGFHLLYDKVEVEVQVRKLHCISKAMPTLPINIEDAARSEKEIEEALQAGEQLVRVNQDTRLNYRVLDMRTPANQGIFHIQHEVGRSPQLHKQMAICGDKERVFEVGPVFRAEDSYTHRHLCEFVGLDVEMEIKKHYSEVMDIVDRLFVTMFDHLNEKCKKELDAVRRQYPFEPLKYLRKTLRLRFEEGIQMLKVTVSGVITYPCIHGCIYLCYWYGTEFYILHRYPLAVRPFYTMPCYDDAQYSNSFDVFIRGEEIISGAQRVHVPELLEERAKACGIDVNTITTYIDSFRYGAPPHGGFGVGLERVVMLFWSE